MPFSNASEIALTIVITCLVFPIFKYDLTGFNQRLPKSDNISEVYYSLYGFNEYYSYTQYGVSYENTTDLYLLLNALTDDSHMQSDYNGDGRISIGITLKTDILSAVTIDLRNPIGNCCVRLSKMKNI